MSRTSITADIESTIVKTIAAEYSYFTPRGEPLCWPVTPYWNPEEGTIGVSTGLAYPTKADHAKVNPKVALLFSDPTGSGIEGFELVLIQGVARVLDQDLQANTDRYVRALREKFLSARLAINPITVKLLDFYLPRIWVDITPTLVLVGDEVHGSAEMRDPLPSPERPRLDGRDLQALSKVVSSLGEGVITIDDGDGYPFSIRSELMMSGDHVEIAEESPPGPAALTLHKHQLGGTRFSAWMARGDISSSRGRTLFKAYRTLGSFGNGSLFPLSAVPEIGRMRRRLRKELDRRGASMPTLRIPG